MRRGASSIAANPVLIGAATTLVVVVAVFLAYNANSGLPFVPTYSLKAEVPSGANLVAGNEVRVGGTRVGVVTEISPKRYPSGRVTAILDMKLETTVKPMPTDSTVLVRPRSALGLKYVELTKGSATEGYEDGDTLPLRAATPEAVEFDEFLSTFDPDTQAAQQSNLQEFGNALAGRGQDLNQTIGRLNPLFTVLEPVMRNLADDRTQLGGLFRALERTASEVAPVAEEQADLFGNLDTTFGALADVAPDLQESISEGPATLDASIRGFRIQRPVLANTEGLFRELRPGAAALRGSADDLAAALEIGEPALRRSVALNKELIPTFEAVERFAEDPLAKLGLRGLGNTVDILNPTLREIVPGQTVCNYATILLRNAASLLSEGDDKGTWQRFIVVAPPAGPNNEASPASGPANGPGKNFLHANPYPNTAQPSASTRECEAGNERFTPGRQVIGAIPGNQGVLTEKTERESGGSSDGDS